MQSLDHNRVGGVEEETVMERRPPGAGWSPGGPVLSSPPSPPPPPAPLNAVFPCSVGLRGGQHSSDFAEKGGSIVQG